MLTPEQRHHNHLISERKYDRAHKVQKRIYYKKYYREERKALHYYRAHVES